MEFSVLAIFVAAAFLYFVGKNKNPPSKTRTTTKRPTANQKSQPVPEWLLSRWSEIQTLHKQGKPNTVSPWYFDEPSEAQLRKLTELGFSVPKKNLTKGQASDLIGLKFPPDDEELAILKFFKIPTKGRSQTQARHTICVLFNSEENVKAWEQRAPTTIQKEAIKFFKIKHETSLTHTSAQAMIDQHIESLDPSDSKLEIWNTLENAMEDFSDKDTRQSLGIKKPTITQVLKAIDALLAEGKTLSTINSDDIAERIRSLFSSK